MKLIVISPEAEESREHRVVAELFACGLTDYHLRKPTWSLAQMRGWLNELPEQFHSRIIVHSHHDLSADFALGGVHFRDRSPHPKSNPLDYTSRSMLCSRAVHTLNDLRSSLNEFDRVLFSPVFPSISKSGYAPLGTFSVRELKAVVALPRRAEVIALGGVTVSRIPDCIQFGFDGVAVLGAIWQAPNPLLAFAQLQEVLHAHAA
jgi:thiamine-phosphate pyrophosphorylase